jgi:hypothetical protein
MKLHVPEENDEVKRVRRGGGVKGKGSKHDRRKQQKWCAVCGLYKSTVHCVVCKVPICAPGARNVRGDPAQQDLCVRDCWERHKLYGLPQKCDDKADWRGPWWVGYERHEKARKDAHTNKRQRASTGMPSMRNNGL